MTIVRAFASSTHRGRGQSPCWSKNESLSNYHQQQGRMLRNDHPPNPTGLSRPIVTFVTFACPSSSLTTNLLFYSSCLKLNSRSSRQNLDIFKISFVLNKPSTAGLLLCNSSLTLHNTNKHCQVWIFVQLKKRSPSFPLFVGFLPSCSV